MFLWAWLAAPASASALEVDVRHYGVGRTYEVAPGAPVDDTWTQIAVPPGFYGRRGRSPDVHVHIEVVEGADAYDVTVQLDEVARGVTHTVCAPTLRVTKEDMNGRFVAAGSIPAFSTAPDGTMSVQYLEYPLTEFIVRESPPEAPVAPLGDVPFADLAAAQCSFPSMVVLSPGHQSVTEVCVLPDGRQWARRIDVRRGRHGWAKLAPTAE
jgi:hypothetical protein